VTDVKATFNYIIDETFKSPMLKVLIQTISEFRGQYNNSPHSHTELLTSPQYQAPHPPFCDSAIHNIFTNTCKSPNNTEVSTGIMELSLSSLFAHGSESSIYRAKMSWNFCSRERKCRGIFALNVIGRCSLGHFTALNLLWRRCQWVPVPLNVLIETRRRWP